MSLLFRFRRWFIKSAIASLIVRSKNYTNKRIIFVTRSLLDMSETSHFCSRSGEKKNFLPVPGRKKFWSRSRRKKVLGLGLGPFRNKFWCRSQSKIFWSRSRSKKAFWSWSCSEKILVLVLAKKIFWSRSRSKKKFGPGPGPGGTGTILPISSHYLIQDKYQ
jgi:hypothetical protein